MLYCFYIIFRYTFAYSIKKKTMGNNTSSEGKGSKLTVVQRQLIQIILESCEPSLKAAFWAVLKNADNEDVFSYVRSLLAEQQENHRPHPGQPLTPDQQQRILRNKRKAKAIREQNLKRQHYVEFIDQNRQRHQQYANGFIPPHNSPTPPPPIVQVQSPSEHKEEKNIMKPTNVQRKSPPEHKANQIQTTIPATRPFAVTPHKDKAKQSIQTTIPATRPFAVTPAKSSSPMTNPYNTRSTSKRVEEENDYALAKALEEEDDIAAVDHLNNFEAAKALQSLCARATSVHQVVEHQGRGSAHAHQLIVVETVESDSDDNVDVDVGDGTQDKRPGKSAEDGDYGPGFDENGYEV